MNTCASSYQKHSETMARTIRRNRPALTSKRSPFGTRSVNRVGQKQVAVVVKNFPAFFVPQNFAVDGVERRQVGVTR